jgi:hypothetical protein
MSLIVFLASMNVYASANEPLCGTVRIESSNGMATVMVYKLEVPAGDFLPAFETFEIVASGENFDNIDKASQIINGLVDGEEVCLKGEVFQDDFFQSYIVPSERL